MTVVVITPPEPVVDIDTARAHLRITDSSEDALIEIMIAAATANLDGPAGTLGRSIGAQELELRADQFTTPGCIASSPIDLPFGPVTEVVSVKYDDVDGVEQTLASDTYRLVGSDRLALAYGQAWPTPRQQPEAVRIRYLAGYEVVPPALVAAILLMVGDLYENREAQVVSSAIQIVANPTIQALIAPYRAMRV